MHKGALIEAAAELAGLSQKDTALAFNAVVETICQSLSCGEPVQILGFGTFEVRNRKPRRGRNPQTGEPMEIAGGDYPAFRCGKLLKDAVSNQDK
ncbi:MAG: HU family DNA-binding protein [Bacillota bacterium]|nr:HU family DNA-binding protein [Bacillota bacterium]